MEVGLSAFEKLAGLPPFVAERDLVELQLVTWTRIRECVNGSKHQRTEPV